MKSRSPVLHTCFFLAFCGSSPVLPSPDLLVLNRGSNELVLFPDLADSCRRENPLRFSSGKSAQRIFPVAARRGRGSDLILAGELWDFQSLVVFLERQEDGRYAEGVVLRGRNVFSALTNPQDTSVLWVVWLGWNQALLETNDRLWDFGEIRSADMAVDRQGDLLVLTVKNDLEGVNLWEITDGLPRPPVVFPGTSGLAKLVDLDSDGLLDVLAVEPSAVAAHFRNPDGTFRPPLRTYRSLPSVHSLSGVLADFDKDGSLDLLLSGSLLLFGNGEGAFPRGVTTPLPRPISHPWIGDAGDFDGDGFPEVVDGLNVYRGGPGGELRLAFGLPLVAGGAAADVRVTDLNGDGLLDIAVAHGDLTIIEGKGNGFFSERDRVLVGGLPTDMTQGDFDGDGAPEVALLYPELERVKVVSPREGGFGAPSHLKTAALPLALFAADLDGDDLQDLAVNDRTGNLAVHRGSRSGLLEVPLTVGGVKRVLLLADLNDDRLPDLIGADDVRGDLEVRRNVGGAFQLAGSLAAGREPLYALAFDFDGDGRKDLIVANRLGNDLSYFRSRGELEFQPPRTLLSGGGPSKLAALDVSGDGSPDLVSLNAWTSDLSVFEQVPGGSFSPERRMAGFRGLVDMDVGDGMEGLALLGGSSSGIKVLDRSLKERVEEGNEDCLNFENPGSEAVKVLVVEFQPRLFIRGDADSDQTVDISDAVRIFLWLFGGERIVNCPDALDVDDSGGVDVTDGISLFSFLFLGGPQPAPPYLSPGRDPTVDQLPACRQDG